jgi:secreted trypsin-like serine protease
MRIRFLVFLTACLFSSRIEAQISCGISGKPSGLIINGTESQRGAWPWIVAVYSTEGEQFLCGGTLIGLNLVTTVSDPLS